MVWILSFSLCAVLLIGILMLVFPELALPLVASNWRRQSGYRNDY
jgi:hypothetical protein